MQKASSCYQPAAHSHSSRVSASHAVRLRTSQPIPASSAAESRRGILGRRENEGDQEQMKQYDIPAIDLVIVDLYPFEDTVAAGASEADIIEKIDIGGISLIRAAAKNFRDVIIVPSKAEYKPLLDLLKKQGAQSELADRKWFATQAFGVSSHYDTAIHRWFAE